MEENRFFYDPSNASAKKLIQNMESQDKVYETLISEQQEIMESLIGREAELRAAIEVQRAAMGGINNATEVSVRAQRRVVLLENRVQQAAAARSSAEMRASKLKEKIDRMRREKKLFEELTAKMEAAVEQKARDVQEVLKRTMEAHGARGKAKALRAQVMAQAEKNAAAAEAEWQQLCEVIEQDRVRREEEQARKAAERAARMEELMKKQQAVTASLASIHHKPNRRAASVRSPPADDANANINTTGVARKQELASEMKTDEAEEDEMYVPPMERMQYVEANLAAVVAGIEGCSNANEAIKKISELKELCFKLFASLTEAHARIEGLENTLAVAGAGAKVATRMAATAHHTQTKNAQITSNTEGIDSPNNKNSNNNNYKGAKAELQSVCDQIHRLCLGLRAMCPDIDQALRVEGPPTVDTLMFYLGILEQRTVDELHACSSTLLPPPPPSSSVQVARPSGYDHVAYDDGSRDEFTSTIVLELPSVGNNNASSQQGGTAAPSESATSAPSSSWPSSTWQRYRDAVGRLRAPRQSQISDGMLGGGSSGSSNSGSLASSGKVLGIEELRQRAKKAVNARMAEAQLT